MISQRMGLSGGLNPPPINDRRYQMSSSGFAGIGLCAIGVILVFPGILLVGAGIAASIYVVNQLGEAFSESSQKMVYGSEVKEKTKDYLEEKETNRDQSIADEKLKTTTQIADDKERSIAQQKIEREALSRYIANHELLVQLDSKLIISALSQKSSEELHSIAKIVDRVELMKTDPILNQCVNLHDIRYYESWLTNNDFAEPQRLLEQAENLLDKSLDTLIRKQQQALLQTIQGVLVENGYDRIKTFDESKGEIIAEDSEGHTFTVDINASGMKYDVDNFVNQECLSAVESFLKDIQEKGIELKTLSVQPKYQGMETGSEKLVRSILGLENLKTNREKPENQKQRKSNLSQKLNHESNENS